MRGKGILHLLAHDCSGERVTVAVVVSAAARASRVEIARMLNFMMKVCRD
jgi:hypothetical protein